MNKDSIREGEDRLVIPNGPREAGQFASREPSRREFLTTVTAFGISTIANPASLLMQEPANMQPRGSNLPATFRVWVFADAHVGSDKKQGRESLAEALRQSESAAGFDWDIALDLGDMSGEQGTPKDPEGQEIVRQFHKLGGGENGLILRASTPSSRTLMLASDRFQSRELGSVIPSARATCCSS